MAVRFIEGPRMGILSPNITTSGTFAIASGAGRYGGDAIRFNNTTGQQAQIRHGDFSASGETPTDMGITTQLCGQFYFKWEVMDNAAARICAFKTSGGTVGCEVKLNTDGTLGLYSNATLRGTSSTALAQSTWYRIAVKSTKSSSGAQELQINGVSEVSGTWSNGNVVIDRFFLTNDARGTASTDFFYEDIIGDDASFPPDGRVLLSVPNAQANAGANNEWTAGTNGSDYQECDEVPPDGGTTYVQSPTVADSRQLFNFQNFDTIGGTGSAINAVQAVVSVRENTSVTSSNLLRLLTTVAGDTTARNEGTSYTTKGKIYALNPTGAAWTVTTFNSIQMGSVEANAVAMRMDVAYLQVHYTPPPPDFSPKTFTY
jgi:hypothetical protein